MTNYHFISIFIISCILLGIQPSVSAQSSDRVYSPYAQYLTNDTTIPPPVGEPADAALSCFRHDTIYVLVMPTGELYIWLRPDPLMDKYIQSSPYAYCDGNPLIYIDPEGMDIFRYDNETGDFKLEQKTDDNFDLVGKFKYDKKKGNFVLRTRKDGSFKTYTDHLGNNDKIAKGILFDGLNIKQNGHDFNVDKSAEHTLSDFFNFALILDEITGREISGFVLESFEDQKEQIVRFEPYNKNKYNKSITTLYNLSGKQRAIYHFHTHGQADSKIEAITPSEDRDIPAKTKITSFYPNIQLLILHNYGVPIKY